MPKDDVQVRRLFRGGRRERESAPNQSWQLATFASFGRRKESAVSVSAAAVDFEVVFGQSCTFESLNQNRAYRKFLGVH